MEERHQQPHSSEAPAGPGSKMEYVQQRYGSKEDFVHFTKAQTEKMLDQVLHSNETVKYLLESMKKVGVVSRVLILASSPPC